MLTRHEGIGFPSANRALAVIPRFSHDVNGYYRAIGVLPGASNDEIRRAVRVLLRRYHPDGVEPDQELFARMVTVRDVLLDSARRQNYDNLPPGQLFIDPEIRDLMDQMGVPLAAAVPFQQPELPKANDYDYYADDPQPGDDLLASGWYPFLLKLAPAFGYTGVIKVLIYDGGPRFAYRSGLFYIPRVFLPGSQYAAVLFSDMYKELLERFLHWPIPEC